MEAGQMTLHNPFLNTEFFEDLYFNMISLFNILKYLWYILFSVPVAIHNYNYKQNIIINFPSVLADLPNAYHLQSESSLYWPFPVCTDTFQWLKDIF